MIHFCALFPLVQIDTMLNLLNTTSEFCTFTMSVTVTDSISD
jgi:hypothetical protein